MTIEIKAPNLNNTPNPTIFLAGSIEMGKAADWQEKLVQYLKRYDNLTIMNPRRGDWNSSWKQEIEDKNFREQVEWELSSQEEADLIVMYFDPETQSPITLLELGLFAGFQDHLIVCCPDGYWRKGNVEIVCKRYDITFTETWDSFIREIDKAIVGVESYIEE